MGIIILSNNSEILETCNNFASIVSEGSQNLTHDSLSEHFAFLTLSWSVAQLY